MDDLGMLLAASLVTVLVVLVGFGTVYVITSLFLYKLAVVCGHPQSVLCWIPLYGVHDFMLIRSLGCVVDPIMDDSKLLKLSIVAMVVPFLSAVPFVGFVVPIFLIVSWVLLLVWKIRAISRMCDAVGADNIVPIILMFIPTIGPIILYHVLRKHVLTYCETL